MVQEIMDMEARYKLELRDRDPATIEDLILDNCKATEIVGIDDKLINLQNLSVIKTGLTSLKGIPTLPRLQKLDLADNDICDGLEYISKNCGTLLHLNLSGNKISDVQTLAVLKDTTLAELELFNNPVSEDDTYRDKVFKVLPNLQILDGCDVNGEEVDDEIDSGEDSDGGMEGDDSGDEDDVDGPGLSYLDNSQLDEDETEDYDPEVEKKMSKKRKAEDDGTEAPEPKKATEAEQ